MSSERTFVSARVDNKRQKSWRYLECTRRVESLDLKIGSYVDGATSSMTFMGLQMSWKPESIRGTDNSQNGWGQELSKKGHIFLSGRNTSCWRMTRLIFQLYTGTVINHRKKEAKTKILFIERTSWSLRAFLWYQGWGKLVETVEITPKALCERINAIFVRISHCRRWCMR